MNLFNAIGDALGQVALMGLALGLLMTLPAFAAGFVVGRISGRRAVAAAGSDAPSS